MMAKRNPQYPAWASSETEFWHNVMPQSEMPIAGEILTTRNIEILDQTLKRLSRSLPGEQLDRSLSEELLEHPELFHDLRKILGVMDKRAYLELSFLASRTPSDEPKKSLCGCQPWTMAKHPLVFFLRMLSPDNPKRTVAAKMLCDYLMSAGLASALPGFANMGVPGLLTVFENLVEPREEQQRAAKRRGHGCEGALAMVLHHFSVDMVPADKAQNPMGAADPNIDRNTLEIVPRDTKLTYSFDIILRDDDQNVRVAIQSLIHTSDPGQYGVDKSDKTVEIAQQFEKINTSRRRARKPSIELWALLDGIGFSENKPQTLNKMLAVVPFFVQLNTLFKAPLRLHELKLARVKGIQFGASYTAEDITAMTELYCPRDVEVLPIGAAVPTSWQGIRAGNAIVYV
jgi:hypothetical protein